MREVTEDSSRIRYPPMRTHRTRIQCAMRSLPRPTRLRRLKSPGEQARPKVPELLSELHIAPVKPGTIKGHRIGADPADEKEHFYICAQCGQAVDKRGLGQVFHGTGPAGQPSDRPCYF
jgi:hypothetical protein